MKLVLLPEFLDLTQSVKGVAYWGDTRVAAHELPGKWAGQGPQDHQGQVRVQGGLIFILWATETRMLWAVVKLKWS